MAACLSARAQAKAEDEVVATVLTKAITLEQITPPEAANQKQKLPPAEYEAWLLKHRAGNLSQRVIGEVMRDYVRREKLKPSDDELDAIFDKIVKEHIAGKELSADAKKKIAIQRFWALGSARDWRTAKALYEKYGGRVAISSFGAWVSFEARNTVLQQYADRGELKIDQPELKKAFWDFVHDERMAGDVFVQPQNVAERFAHPPWETFQRELAEETAKLPAEK
jgi:hypothetical protein